MNGNKTRRGGGVIKTVDDETKKLVANYYEAEKKLIGHLEEKEGGDEECECGSSDVVETICTIGETSEITKRCLNCGGYKE